MGRRGEGDEEVSGESERWRGEGDEEAMERESGDEEVMGRESEIKRRMMRNFDVEAFGRGKKKSYMLQLLVYIYTSRKPVQCTGKLLKIKFKLIFIPFTFFVE